MDTTAAPGETTNPAEDPAALLATADGLRDRRDWIEAAVGYAAYLRLRPDDWPIWVQYGHCMKESGDAKAALLLYREAERLNPTDADLHLQVGHALKLLGRIEEAYQEYAQALTLDPDNADARAELLATPAGSGPPTPPPPPPILQVPPPRAARPDTMGGAAPAPWLVAAAPAVAPPAERAAPAPLPAAPPPVPIAEAPPPAPAQAASEAAPAEPAPMPAPAAPPADAANGALLLDVSDLLDYFRHNRAPTGIQRVQLQLTGALLDRDGAAGDTRLVVFDPTFGAWKGLPVETFRRLAQLSRAGASAEEPEWAGSVAAAVSFLLRSPPLALGAGARLVNLGSSWWLPDYLRRVREAKERCGLRYIPFLHDCIPLLVPEHCAAGLVDEFARWFAGVALLADKVLCNSASTEADFRRLRGQLLPEAAEAVPTAVIRLDAVLPHEPAAEPVTLPLPLRSGRPFVLCVGTIEARKNHQMVFNAWLDLLRRHGAEAVPDLVCVGKRGWLAEAALALHANSQALRERVHLLHDIPDTALAALYRGCLFTLANSFYEGWGLPVTESLAAGKVPLVPDHSGFRESGAGLAVTFEPQNAPDLVAKLERLAFDAGFRAAQEARIATGLRLRSWADLAAQMLEEVAPERLPPGPGRPAVLAAAAPLGAIHPVALLPGPAPSLAMALADALRDGPAWSVLEPWGAWTLPGTARLRLPVPPGVEGPVRVHLELQGPPKPQRIGLRAAAGAPFRVFELAAGERLLAVVEARAEAGAAGVEIDCAEGVHPAAEGPTPDVRLVGVGVRSVMACRPDDLVARLDWLERAALPRLARA